METIYLKHSVTDIQKKLVINNGNYKSYSITINASNSLNIDSHIIMEVSSVKINGILSTQRTGYIDFKDKGAIFFLNKSIHVILQPGDKLKFEIISGTGEFLGKNGTITVKVNQEGERKVKIQFL